jgi:hypothetical protein
VPPTFAFPEPREPSFLDVTYNNACLECGVHGKQKSDFIIKKEIDALQKKLYSLHWVFDELFCETTVYSAYFEKKILYRNVGIAKSVYSKIVKQLVLSELEENLQ